MKKLLAILALLFAGAVCGAELRVPGTFSYVPQPGAGTILRSDGTSWLGTTATFASTYTSGGLLFSNGANTVQGSPFITFSGTVFQFAGDNPAADLTYNVTHTGSNAASRGVISVAQGGAGGGDAVMQWILSGVQTWTAGADISASSAWKLSAGTALGTNDAISVTTAGVVSFPTAALGLASGGTGLTSAADDTVMVSSGAAWVATAVPDCTDTTGNHLNYTASTNAFSCGTSGPTPSLTLASNVLSGDVALNNSSNFFDGPSMAQGTTGTWCASGNVTLTDNTVGNRFYVKLWDGTTVINSTEVISLDTKMSISLGGCLATPAGNIRMSVRDLGSTIGTIAADTNGQGKNSTIYGWRVQ